MKTATSARTVAAFDCSRTREAGSYPTALLTVHRLTERSNR